MEMRELRVPLIYELHQKLQIIHSYQIVKKLIKLTMHTEAAMLLDRVCHNIKQFHSNAVNILTTAVIEASRAQLKHVAFNWACVLITEYR